MRTGIGRVSVTCVADDKNPVFMRESSSHSLPNYAVLFYQPFQMIKTNLYRPSTTQLAQAKSERGRRDVGPSLRSSLRKLKDAKNPMQYSHTSSSLSTLVLDKSTRPVLGLRRSCSDPSSIYNLTLPSSRGISIAPVFSLLIVQVFRKSGKLEPGEGTKSTTPQARSGQNLVQGTIIGREITYYRLPLPWECASFPGQTTVHLVRAGTSDITTATSRLKHGAYRLPRRQTLPEQSLTHPHC